MVSSQILRHKPETIGITLDEHGWADVQELIAGINQSGGHTLDMKILEEIVRSDEKQRCSFDEDHTGMINSKDLKDNLYL